MGNERARWPTDPDVRVEVRSAVGRYDDFYEVVGVKKPGGKGCWCMAYRDSRVSSADSPGYMQNLCAAETGGVSGGRRRWVMRKELTEAGGAAPAASG